MSGEGIIAELVVSLSLEDTLSTALDNANSKVQETAKSFDEAAAHTTSFGFGLEETGAKSKSFGERIGGTATAFATIGYSVDHVMHMFDRYEITQISVENANLRVTAAQENLNEAIAKYGEGSTQAIDASRSLEIAQNNLDRTNIRANSSMVLIALSAVSMVPQFITLGGTIVTAMTTGTVAINGTKVALATLAPELLIVGAIVGALYYTMTDTASATEGYGNASETAAGKVDSLTKESEDLLDVQDKIWKLEDRLTSMTDDYDTANNKLLKTQKEHKTATEEVTKWQAIVNDLIDKGKTNTPEYDYAMRQLTKAKDNDKDKTDKLIDAEDVMKKYRGMAITETPEYKKVELELAEARAEVKRKTDESNKSIGVDAPAALEANKQASLNWKTFVVGVLTSAFDAIKTVVINAVKFVDQGIQIQFEAFQRGIGIAKDIIIATCNGIIDAINLVIKAYNSIPVVPDIPTIPSIGGGGCDCSCDSCNTSCDCSCDSCNACDCACDSCNFADGGIITKATTVRVAESGPEAIIPLPGFLRNLGSGGQGINLTVQFNAPIYGVDDIDKAIQTAFDKIKWNVGRLGI